MQASSNVARGFAIVLGLVYLAVGLIGFVATGFTGPVVFDTDDALLGFDLNIFHNIVHIALGAILLVASRARDVSITQGVLIGVGLFVVVAALLGFIGYLDNLLSIDGKLAADNFLHLVTGGAAVIFGLIAVRQHDEEPAWSAQRPRSLDERRALWDKEETYREKAY